VTNQLSYAPRSVSDRRRRIARRVGYSVVAGIAFIFAILCFRQVPARLQAMNAQRPLMNFRFPPNQLAYSDSRFKVTFREEPQEWNAFKSFVFNNPGYPTTLFLHRLVGPSGKSRIVRISCQDRYGNGYLFCATNVIQPGTLFSPPRMSFESQAVLLPKAIGESFEIFAGQPDPNDEGHFTITYKCGLRSGIIDGWLENDDTVKLQPRV
jgi:hypothetical protein